ncbi:SDR family oxidoreductase [Nocardia donostiensis]|uniref:Short-chain dehydrogenase n=1 Tax=Nocardia donostiensis TaxID=1538463 RepID=A0A1V2TFY7_9NOCA|nr:SDR family oxidoreductase [Nocardia donostiensis]ONM48415.1 short-chain dehydrogenase [Nocardia donostiensis]OQS16197.1 short-chain dehydrogenase [Nocardia donostiensis]OQS17825.1 short-chain dehydrogenase [Nocardia donostiensis]
MPDRDHEKPLRVVITGASSGIGQATAELFARRGVELVLGARNLEALEEVASRCRSAGGVAIAVRTDVTDIEAVRALADRAVTGFGGIDVWVSNVGVGAIGRFQDTPMESHEQVIRSNLIGHMNDAHAVLPVFLRQGHGTFVNIISLGGFAAAPYAAAYSAGKYGLRGFAESLRAELARHPDIHICDIYPGFVDTPGLRHGANYVGRKITSPPPVLDPWRVAAAIVRRADHPKPTTMVGTSAVMARLMHAVSPTLTRRTMERFLSAYFDRAERVPTSDGNLFQPSPDAAVVEGNLRSPWKRAAAGAMTGAAATTTGYLLLKRRKTRPESG